VNILEPEIAQRINHLTLRALSAVEGMLGGIHMSPHAGSSIEFLEHKQYTPGDELRQVDWKLLARTDKYYVKQFENETNLRAYAVLDTSASMDYSSEGRGSKFDYASRLCAALAWLLLRQGDAVALAAGARPSDYIPPRSNAAHFRALVQKLASLHPSGDGTMSQLLFDLSGRIHRHSMVIVLSDLLEPVEQALQQVKLLRYRRNEVIVFHVLDPWELEFPFRRLTLFESMEDDREVLADAGVVRKAYLQALRGHIATWRSECLVHGIEYVLMDTSRPISQSLAEYLAARASAQSSARRR